MVPPNRVRDNNSEHNEDYEFGLPETQDAAVLDSGITIRSRENTPNSAKPIGKENSMQDSSRSRENTPNSIQIEDSGSSRTHNMDELIDTNRNKTQDGVGLDPETYDIRSRENTPNGNKFITKVEIKMENNESPKTQHAAEVNPDNHEIRSRENTPKSKRHVGKEGIKMSKFTVIPCCEEDAYTSPDTTLLDNSNSSKPKFNNNTIQIVKGDKKGKAEQYNKTKGTSKCCGSKSKLICGTLCVLLGVATFIWTPLQLMLMERIQMTPGLPAYEWWVNPPDTVIFKIYLFNITNGESFLNGTDSHLHFEEVGPIVYKELLSHSNTTFNSNSTLTYVAKRWLEFIPELNKHVDLNSTINIVNIPLLGFASYLSEKEWYIKATYRFMSNKEPVLVNRTIYEYLWNYTDPLVTKGSKLLPNLVPVSNLGMLQTMYKDLEDEVTVFIGNKWGDEKFFTIDKVHGKETLPGLSTCNDTLKGSTEGLLYSQHLTKNSTLLYWRKTTCKVVELFFKEEVTINNVKAYKYIVPNNTYYRINKPNKTDCYAGSPPLFDGLTDVSKCYFDFPMAMSLPHFYGVDERVLKNISGFDPDPIKHGSYAIVEPLTGVPLESCARSQSNLVIKDLTTYNKKIRKFSNMIIPMFWAEYSQMSLPDYVWIMVKTTVNVLPVGQVVFSCVITLIGLALVYVTLRKLFCRSPYFHTHAILLHTKNTIRTEL